MSEETRIVWREAENKKPEEYLLLLRRPRNHRHSRRRGRRAALARTRKASDGRDGETVICTEESLPNDASIQAITESEVATEEPDAAKGNVRITGSSGQMVCSLLCWLLALILSVLLLRYLYRRSRKCAQGEAAPFDEPFFCPPDFGKTISPNDAGTERCTCCSKPSTTRCASEDPFSSRQSTARNCNVKKLAGKCLPRRKKARKKAPPPAPAPPSGRKASRRPARFSESEIREIQNKVARALRDDGAYCECDGKGVLPQERAKPRRYKFFRFKKKNVSDDFGCHGSKKVLFEANTSTKTTKEKSPCSRRTDLRIRNS